MFTGGDELLGQQVAETAGGLDRPRPLRERLRPPQQPLELIAGRLGLHATERFVCASTADRGVRRLVGSTPINTMCASSIRVGSRDGHS